jgi:cytochrome c
MVGSQLSNGAIMRESPKGAVTTEGERRYLGESPADALKLSSPIPKTPDSILSGLRLYNVNCSPCHGKWIDNKLVAATMPLPLAGPRILQKSDYLTRQDFTEGYIFQTIHYGLRVLMPRYGWKLSMREHWDIVNFIKDVHAK